MSTNAPQPAGLPALLGGPPVRPAGPPHWPEESPDVHESVERALRDGSWSSYHGPNSDALCAKLQQEFQVQHAGLFASGTAAVEMGLRGLCVGSGDEVLMSAYDFKGNFQDVLALDATPVLVDVLPGRWMIDPQRIEQGISDRTKVLLVSHLHGELLDMPALRQLADRHGLAILEDACQVPGAVIAGRPAGAWGDAAALSFGGSKLLSAGRGGALLTDRQDVVQRVRLHTHRGNDAYPLSELQAAALLPQLERLGADNARRAASVRTLVEHGQAICGGLPSTSRGPQADNTAYYKLGLTVDQDRWGGLSAELVARAVQAEGFALHSAFRSLHRVHSRRRFRAVGDLPEASQADVNTLVLHHPLLKEGPEAMRQLLVAIQKIQLHADALQAACAQNPAS